MTPKGTTRIEIRHGALFMFLEVVSPLVSFHVIAHEILNFLLVYCFTSTPHKIAFCIILLKHLIDQGCPRVKTVLTSHL